MTEGLLSGDTEEVSKKMEKRNNLLEKITGASWGWKKEKLRKVCPATPRSIAEYASPTWTPWLSKTE